MANKIYNSKTRKYNNIPDSDAVGAYVLYENGSKEYFLDTALTDGLVTTATIGSLAITSNATGRGKIFSSDGSAWQEIATQSGVGGASIGGIVSGATQGSVPFIGAGGALTQDNIAFNFDDANNALKIGGQLSIGGTPNNTARYINGVFTSSVASLHGVHLDLTNNGSSGSNIAVYGRMNHIGTNIGDYAAVGGYFSAQNSDVPTFALDGSVSTAYNQGSSSSAVILNGISISAANEGAIDFSLIGVNVDVFSGAGSTSSGNTAGIKVAIRNGGVMAERRGIDFSDWVSDSIPTISSAIYADTSIDAGTTKYFINSLSTSPSILSGNLTINGTGKFFITTPETPASAAATGTVGQIAWDSNFIYVCTATNTWKRVALATW